MVSKSQFLHIYYDMRAENKKIFNKHHIKQHNDRIPISGYNRYAKFYKSIFNHSAHIGTHYLTISAGQPISSLPVTTN